MEKSNSNVVKTKRMKCPECLNFMIANVHDNGDCCGKCPVCSAVVFWKEHSPKEKLIKIRKI